MAIRKNLITMDEILVKRTENCALFFVSGGFHCYLVAAFALPWRPGSATVGSTIDHRRHLSTIAPHKDRHHHHHPYNAKGGKIPAIAVGGGAVRQSAWRLIAVSRQDPSLTSDHRYTTSHHTKITAITTIHRVLWWWQIPSLAAPASQS